MFKLRYLTYSDFGLIEKWYEDMAKKGWQIEKIPLPFIHKFKKSKAGDIEYKISLAQNESYFSSFTKSELDDFNKMSEEFGWKLVDRSFNMNLYKLEKDAAESLYNDDVEELKILNKGIKGEIITLILTGLVLLLNFFFMSASFHSPDIFYSNLILFLYPASILFLVFAGLSIIDNISFRNKNKNVKYMRDIKFSKISYSKTYLAILILGFTLLIIGIISNLISSSLNNRFLLIGLLPILLAVIIFISIKKIKQTNFKTKNKKIIMILLVALITIISAFITSYSLSFIPDSYKSIDTSEEVPLNKSFLAKSHTMYNNEGLDLQVKEIVAQNSDLASILFDREVKNATNHPYNSDLVKDISSDFTYEKAYRLANENAYIILDNQTVLKVMGDINNKKIQVVLEELLGD